MNCKLFTEYRMNYFNHEQDFIFIKILIYSMQQKFPICFISVITVDSKPIISNTNTTHFVHQMKITNEIEGSRIRRFSHLSLSRCVAL